MRVLRASLITTTLCSQGMLGSDHPPLQGSHLAGVLLVFLGWISSLVRCRRFVPASALLQLLLIVAVLSSCNLTSYKIAWRHNTTKRSTHAQPKCWFLVQGTTECP